MSSNDTDHLKAGVSLSDFLKPDTPEVKQIRSLQDNEAEYSEHLGTIEGGIALYYHEHDNTITDKEIISILRDIKMNLDKDVSYFSHPFEILMLGPLVDALEKKPITFHEFKLVIDYILWSIDNRSWMGDKQAYIKWICYFLGVYTAKEEKQYEERMEKLGKKMHLSDEDVDQLLMRGEREFTEDEIEKTRLQSEFFAMDADEKLNFLAENSPEHFDLFAVYLLELKERRELELMKILAKRVSKKFGDDPELYLHVAIFFMDEDPNIAKSYLAKALSKVELLEGAQEQEKKSLEIKIKKLIRGCDRKNK
ncbi:hypothetical protein [Methanomethylovorans sp.]|uniref:hypothetical protein n=1 Tax=Methanomethylovorans sp. TaxID=2758717 RepID=UPI000AB2002E|nr:hypothetical protein [Methanomethylovorans sp.]